MSHVLIYFVCTIFVGAALLFVDWLCGNGEDL